jgi:hypothetical protein
VPFLHLAWLCATTSGFDHSIWKKIKSFFYFGASHGFA